MKIDAKGLKGVKVNVFLDVDWPKVYEKDLPCDEFVSHAQESIPLDERGDDFRFNFRQKKRPHYWFLTVSHCGGDSELPLDVTFEVTFINSGNRWDKQFSYDEQGLFVITLAFLIIFLMLLGVHFRGLSVWWEAEKYIHPILKLLTASMCLEAFSLFLEFTHLCAFAYDGEGFPTLASISKLSDVLSQLLLIAIVILIAKGWTISRVDLEHANFIIAVLGGLSGAYLLLFLYDLYYRNPASTVYIYDSFPGYVILIIRLATFAWFLALLKETIEFEFDDLKRQFFGQFRLALAVWFAYLPLIVLLSIFLDAWVRRKTVEALYQSMNFVVFATMAFLLWPSRAAKYFKIAGPDLMAFSGGDAGL
jgi:predicted transporter